VDVFVVFVGGFGVGNGSGVGGAFVEGAIHALHVSVTQIHVMRRNHGVTRRNNHVTAMKSVMRMMQRMIRMMAKQLVQHLSVSMMRIPAIDQMSVVEDPSVVNDMSVVKDSSVVQNMTMAITDAVSLSVPVSVSASVMDLIDAVMSESVSVRASVMGGSIHVVNGVGQMVACDLDLVRVILTLDFLSFCCHVFTIYQ